MSNRQLNEEERQAKRQLLSEFVQKQRQQIKFNDQVYTIKRRMRRAQSVEQMDRQKDQYK